MSLRPFWKYYGGKWRIAPLYPPPKHPIIVEPFAGAAGYSLRYPDRNVILVDKDPVICALWRWLIRVPASDVLALPLNVGHIDDVKACEEARALVGFWLNAATTAPCRVPSAWMRSGTTPMSFWGQRARRLVASQIDSIRHWKVIEGDYSAAPGVQATWFVDPPYQHAGKHYRYGSRHIDFAALGAWCQSREGQVIVCENVGADWLPFVSFTKARSSPKTQSAKYSREAVWMNEPAAQMVLL